MTFALLWGYLTMEKQAKLKNNFLYSVGYQLLIIILPLITAPYVSRVLGAENVGIYSYTQAFANYFYLFAMLGVNNYGNRMIAAVRDKQKDLDRTFWEIFFFQSLLAIFVSFIYIIYAISFIKENRLIYLLQSFYVLSSVFDINWVCFGLENFKLTTVRSTIIRLCMAAATFLFVNNLNDLWIYTFILSFGNFIAALVVWPFVLKHIHFIKPSWSGIKRHIKPNLVLFWPVIAVSLYNIMDKLMLGMFSTKEEVAFYTYAERITQLPNTLILALDNVIMPRMSNLYAKNNKEKTRNLMDNVMLFAMFMAAAMAFGLAGVAPVFAPWFYGEAFTRCGLFIVMLCPITVFKGWAGALRTQYIIPAHKDNVYIISLTTGAVVNLILNFFFIPRFSGVGAIIGTIAAEFTVMFIQFFMCRNEIPIKKYMVNGLCFCAIGFVMYLGVDALSSVSNNAVITMGIQILVGVIVYVIMACVYMIKVKKNPVLINEGLKMLHIKKRF